MLSSPKDTSDATAEPTGTPPATSVTDTALEDNTLEDMVEDLGDDVDEETRLKFLTTGTRAQDDLERDIGRQAEQLLAEQADERDKKRMQKTEAEIKRTEEVIRKLRNRLVISILQPQKIKLRAEILENQKKIEEFDKELDSIQQRINDRHKSGPGKDEQGADVLNKPLPNESRRDFLIRTGKITPFSKLAQNAPVAESLGDVMLDAEMEDDLNGAINDGTNRGPVSHRNLMKPGFQDESSASEAPSPPTTSRPSKRRKVASTENTILVEDVISVASSPLAASDEAYTPDLDDRELAALGDSDGVSDGLTEDDVYEEATGRKRRIGRTISKNNKAITLSTEDPAQEDFAGVDDGNEKVYQNRLRSWMKNRSIARQRAQRKQGADIADEDDDEECYQPHPTEPDTVLDGGLRIPGDIYPALFDYQKTGVQWLWELYQQNVGGIIGDEMGLGKTIQAISFVAGLHYSKKLTRPVIVVCPATVMKQWVNEFHRWWPAFRVSILHTSGSGMLDTRREDRMEREMEMDDRGDYDVTLTNAGKAAKRIVERVKRDGHVLVTTYSGLQTYAEFLIPTEWECAILDEGHKIRNPNTAITIHCKELRTPNRIILSGTPMQNNLTELWSLFDFVFPMRLGTLVNFRNQFEFPIKRGGYANASNLEFETAMRCAETLKDAISPYLLQRFKVDVATDLPQKKEQVLFCKLTRQQRVAYENFLNSSDMKSIADGKRQMLFGVDYLRKICNHPDLTEHKKNSKQPWYGAANKSGKMQVVKELLSIWKKGGHKTLLFAQHRIMLDILEKYVRHMPDFNYRRMDGETPIQRRQDLIDEFNNNPDIHVFLLTTKVGGLGVNLTGADRVIIYDPDWNPSTDIQARERSWRLGQKREVEIYRLMTAGTIEEKIYHRQIFKQFLTNKVLKDPKQRQTFQMSDLHDLFTLGSDKVDGETETGTLFRGSEVNFNDKGNSSIPTPPLDSPRKGKQAADGTAAETLATVAGIDHTEDFKESSGEEDAGQEVQDGKSDERLLGTIFARSGVHSVLEHDAIVNSTASGRKRKVQADPAFIQREAKRAAAEAAAQLKKAEAEARQLPAGIPTWTGTRGEAGRPPSPPRQAAIQRGLSSSRGGRGGATRGGPSSASILNNLAARQGRATTPQSRASTPGSSDTTASLDLRGRKMLEKLRDFMVTHGGSVPTQMLVDHFDRYTRRERVKQEEFKEMLKLVARLEKGSAGRSRWVLKEEWKSTGATRGH